MSISTTRWVLWISLLFLIPLPVYGTFWGCLPVAYLLLSFFHHREPALLLHALFWGGLLWWVAWAYGRWSARWEPKIRGSIMAIAVLTLLVLFSSIPVYRQLNLPGAEGLTFQWLYD